MAAKLSTHVLDLTRGMPAAGVKIELWRLDTPLTLVKTVETNADGRTDEPLLGIHEIAPGPYELVFFVREYFSAQGVDSPFLGHVPIRFEISADASYHVPLLVTPWGYSTYRGS